MKKEFWRLIRLPKDEKREKICGLFEKREDVRELTLYLSSRALLMELTLISELLLIIQSAASTAKIVTLNVQALVGANMEFLHIYIGAPRRVHEQNTFREFKLEECISNGEMILCKYADFHGMF
jgi:hypothetical protein